MMNTTSEEENKYQSRKGEETMKNMNVMNEVETREANGGSAYCLVCGYGKYNNYSDWKVMAHIAAKHPADVLRGMGNLILRVF